ncbi:MAG: YciI family protein [Planctomycetia bacterium]|nr:YciI family protein [Planctomycetia bacterium]
MKFICLGYIDESKWDCLASGEQTSCMEECLAYDAELKRGGHFAGGMCLESVRHAVTLKHRTGGVEVTDGPFIETKEHLGGILILEARDLNHAIQLMSQHPGVKMGPFEIRALDEKLAAQVGATV